MSLTFEYHQHQQQQNLKSRKKQTNSQNNKFEKKNEAKRKKLVRACKWLMPQDCAPWNCEESTTTVYSPICIHICICSHRISSISRYTSSISPSHHPALPQGIYDMSPNEIWLWAAMCLRCQLRNGQTFGQTFGPERS